MPDAMQHYLVGRWEHWCELIGRAPAGRQRREVLRRLRSQPALLFWGDCWFASPLDMNLARHVARSIDGIAMWIGKPGASVDELFTPAHIRGVCARLRSNPFDLLCLSAGGPHSWISKLGQLFKPWSTDRRKSRFDATQAFERVCEARLYERIHGRYANLLEALQPLQRERPAFAVLAHSYAAPRCIGLGGDLKAARLGQLAALQKDPGPWLWKSLQHAVADRTTAQQLAELLVQGLCEQVFRPLQSDHGGLFSWADFSAVPELQRDTGWSDELHPSEAGLAALAVVYRDRLRELLPIAKRAAVR